MTHDPRNRFPLSRIMRESSRSRIARYTARRPAVTKPRDTPRRLPAADRRANYNAHSFVLVDVGINSWPHLAFFIRGSAPPPVRTKSRGNVTG